LSLSIRDMQAQAWVTAEDHGFHDPVPSFGELIALIHSELSEALEAYREGLAFVDVYVVGVDELYDEGKPVGIWSELADVVIRVGDMAGILGIDLENAVVQKMLFNEGRPYRHGDKRL
jgi:NTP pyrophosphatase (non-canonical NTP hydrolase)